MSNGAQEFAQREKLNETPATEVRRAIAVDQVTDKPITPVIAPLGLRDKISLAKDGWEVFTLVRNHYLSPSWKTSLMGAGGLVTVVLALAQSYASGQPVSLTDVAAKVVIAVGLLYAKDASVTGTPKA